MSSALAPLWNIEQELIALLDSVDTCPEELQPELQAQIDAYMGQEVAKVDQIAHVLAALEYEQKAAGDEIARLQERKKAAAKAQERLEAYVCRVIAARGVKKLAGRTNSLSVRPSDAVVIVDEAAIPDQWRRSVTVKMPLNIWRETFEPFGFENLTVAFDISKVEIKRDLKAGYVIPGADLEFRTNLVRR